MGRFRSLAVVLSIVLGVSLTARVACAGERAVVGSVFEYRVRRDDTLGSVGARYAVDPATLARQNGLRGNRKLVPGSLLEIDNRHVVTAALGDGIVINLPQRLLFLFDRGGLAAWYPVGLGQPGTWQTPGGSYRVVSREENPVWEVPESIRDEMRRSGQRVRTRVPPGRDNPLGRNWIGLSLACCGIHGTVAPQSVYRFESHGCIRLAPEHAKELFSRVKIGTRVEIVYEPVLAARSDDGTIFLEVHPDVYGGRKDQTATADAIANGHGYQILRDSSRWRETVRAQEGIAVPVFSPIETGRDAGAARETRQEPGSSRH
jgi:L,D-transpeptidase ErfK/SrfK